MHIGMIVGTVIAVVIVAAALFGMLRSWRRRERRDEALAAYPLPATEGPATFEAEALYVATTPAEDPLERIAIAGLAFRGTARVRVEAAGLELRVAGEGPVWLPADRIVGAERASWAIDRGVEKDGLVAITWLAERRGPDGEPAVPAVLTSSLRARAERDASRLIDAVAAIATAELPAADEPEATDGTDPAAASDGEARPAPAARPADAIPAEHSADAPAAPAAANTTSNTNESEA